MIVNFPFFLTQSRIKRLAKVYLFMDTTGIGKRTLLEQGPMDFVEETSVPVVRLVDVVKKTLAVVRYVAVVAAAVHLCETQLPFGQLAPETCLQNP